MDVGALVKALGAVLEPAAAARSLAAVDVVMAGSAETAGAQAAAAVAVVETPAVARDYHKILSQDALETWLAKLAAAPLMAFDTETDTPDYMQARIVGMSFPVAPGDAAHVPLGHDSPAATRQLERQN